MHNITVQKYAKNLMDIKEAGEKYLQPLSLLIEGKHNQETFEKYISGLMLENKNFSTLNISEHTEEKELSQLYYFLEQSINWRKLLYTQAKAVLKEQNTEEFILIIDSSPIKQEYAEHRITKKGFVNISEMERVPNNEVVGLYITNGKVYNPLEFKLWGSPKLVSKDQYKKKPAMLIEFLQYYGMNGIPVKRIVFDAFFNSKANLKWLIENGYTFITRIECNRIVYVNGEKHVLKENLKILRFCYQDEEYYVVTNDLKTTDDVLKQEYLDRWGVEVFHREAKQKLGLEKMLIRSWKRLTNRVGLICVVYGFLTALEQHLTVSVGKMKRVIQDLVYSTHDGADRLGNLVFC